MILYSASDLIWATKIKGTADSIGTPCRPVRNLEMLEARLADSDVRGLIVDLDAPDLALELIARLRQSASPPDPSPGAVPSSQPAGPGTSSGDDAPATIDPTRVRILAFGPHVNKDLLQQARDAGADDVLPRGAFDANLAEILINLDGRGGDA